MVSDWNSLIFCSVYYNGYLIVTFFWKERDAMYSSFGSLGTRVHASLVMMYIREE